MVTATHPRRIYPLFSREHKHVFNAVSQLKGERTLLACQKCPLEVVHRHIYNLQEEKRY